MQEPYHTSLPPPFSYTLNNKEILLCRNASTSHLTGLQYAQEDAHTWDQTRTQILADEAVRLPLPPSWQTVLMHTKVGNLHFGAPPLRRAQHEGVQPRTYRQRPQPFGLAASQA
jgi:hypothetical protein